MHLSDEIVRRFPDPPQIEKQITNHNMRQIIQNQLHPHQFRIIDSEYDLYSVEEFKGFLDDFYKSNPYEGQMPLFSKEKKWTRRFNTGLGYLQSEKISTNFFVDPNLQIWVVEPHYGKIYRPTPESVIDLALI